MSGYILSEDKERGIFQLMINDQAYKDLKNMSRNFGTDKDQLIIMALTLMHLYHDMYIEYSKGNDNIEIAVVAYDTLTKENIEVNAIPPFGELDKYRSVLNQLKNVFDNNSENFDEKTAKEMLDDLLKGLE